MQNQDQLIFQDSKTVKSVDCQTYVVQPLLMLDIDDFTASFGVEINLYFPLIN